MTKQEAVNKYEKIVWEAQKQLLTDLNIKFTYQLYTCPVCNDDYADTGTLFCGNCRTYLVEWAEE